MKGVAIGFEIAGMVTSAIGIIVESAYYSYAYNMPGLLALIILAIVPIVLGLITIHKIRNAVSKEELIPWGVVSILLVGVVGGILTLCIPQDDLF